jgi:hypothetical protein
MSLKGYSLFKEKLRCMRECVGGGVKVQETGSSEQLHHGRTNKISRDLRGFGNTEQTFTSPLVVAHFFAELSHWLRKLG